MSAVIYVSYPRQEGITFDMDYYLNTHMRLVQEHWGPHGMQRWDVVKFEEGDPSGAWIRSVLFDSDFVN